MTELCEASPSGRFFDTLNRGLTAPVFFIFIS